MAEAQAKPPKIIDVITSERDAEFAASFGGWWQDPEKRPVFRFVRNEEDARRFFEDRERRHSIIVLYSPELFERIYPGLLLDLLGAAKARSKLVLWMRGEPPSERVRSFAPVVVPETPLDELSADRRRAAIKELLRHVTRPRGRPPPTGAVQSYVAQSVQPDLEEGAFDETSAPIQAILEPPGAEAAPSGKSVPIQIRSDDLPGFLADTVTGKDHLGTAEEAQRMARLIASWEVVPPLAIGVFGEWGSGKSHFMRTVRTNVESLSRSARATYPEVKQRDAGYYRGMVQIEFNAWHYVRGDLWASLMEHIFTNLRRETSEESAAVKERGSAVLEKILEKREEKRKAEIELDKARADLRAAESLKDSSEKQADTLHAASVRLDDVIDADELTALRTTLGDSAMFKDLAVVANDLALARRHMRSTGARLSSLLRFAKAELDLRSAAKWALVLAVPAIAAFIAWALAQPPLTTAVTSGATAVAALLARVRPYAQKVSDSLDALERAEAEVTRRVQLQRERAENELKEAQARVQAAAEKVARWEQKVKEVSAAALLREFVAERAECDDYRKHLGLAALVRRDFQALSDLIEDQRKTEVKGEETFDETTVNRIVLYIDDLDRCPPERVVDVLQAVHLLLAFPLFVVVLAVDARWVRSCLRERYAGALSDAGEGEDEPFVADPEDYLEKIFQIPYWVRPMTVESTQVYMRGIATPFAGPRGPPAGAADPGDSLDGVAEDDAPDDEPSPGTPPEAAKPPPVVLRLSTEEIDALADVAPLLKRSPRTGKRFLNCYQLVRAGQTGETEAAFLGATGGHPHYLDLMQMLAIVVGAPNEVPAFERLLREARDVRSLIGSITSDEERWVAIRMSLEARLERAPHATSVDIMRRVLPRAKRFSFHSPSAEVG